MKVTAFPSTSSVKPLLFRSQCRDYTDFFTDQVNQSLNASNQFSKDSVWEAFHQVGHRPEVLRQLIGRVAINHEAPSFSKLIQQDATVWHSQVWNEFDNDFNALSPLQQAILTLLIRKGRAWSPFAEESIRYYQNRLQQDTVSIASVQSSIQSLREKEFIWQSGRGHYALEDESFAQWFRYSHPCD